MSTILVVLILLVGIPILIGHMIYFGSRYDEWRRIEVQRGRRRQDASPPAIGRA